MPAFAVMINGRNFLVEIDGELRRCGFFTTRHVTADTPEQAESIAISSLRQRPSLRDVPRNAHDDPPMTYVEEIVEIEAVVPDPGLAWYEEEESAPPP